MIGSQGNFKWLETCLNISCAMIFIILFNTTALFAETPAPGYEVLAPARFATLTSRQVNDELRKLEAAFPGLITHTVAGISANGREIYCMRLSGAPDESLNAKTTTASGMDWLNPGNPVLLVEAGTHARETANPYLAYRILVNYAQDYLDESLLPFLDMGKMLHSFSFDFVVLSNPDGYDLVKFGKTPITAPGILTFLNSITPSRFPLFKASATGVDLNRNYPASYYNVNTRKWIDLWGKKQNGLPASHDMFSTVPAAQFYGGSAPASEPETRAMMALIRQRDYRMVISLHSAGNVVYWDRPYLSGPYNNIAKKFGILAGVVTKYKVYPTDIKENNSGYFGDFVANETQKACLTIETTHSYLPSPWQVFLEAYNRVAALPYHMAEMSMKTGFARYRLLDADGLYIRDMADIAYAQAVAAKNGWTVKDAGPQ